MALSTLATGYFPLKGFSPSEKLFVLTDLHGCCKAMERLLEYYDGKSKLLFLGDAIDRGPDSYGVIKRLMELDAINLTGNHECMSLKALYKERFGGTYSDFCLWFVNGAEATIDSLCRDLENRGRAYRPEGNEDYLLPKIYDTYLNSMKSHYLSGNILFCHAGISPEEEIRFYDNPFDDPLYSTGTVWFRPNGKKELYYESPRIFQERQVFIVCGHTSVIPSVAREPYGIMLDLGCRLKAALEIEPVSEDESRYRMMVTGCDEIMPAGDVQKALDEIKAARPPEQIFCQE